MVCIMMTFEDLFRPAAYCKLKVVQFLGKTKKTHNQKSFILVGTFILLKHRSSRFLTFFYSFQVLILSRQPTCSVKTFFIIMLFVHKNAQC